MGTARSSAAQSGTLMAMIVARLTYAGHLGLAQGRVPAALCKPPSPSPLPSLPTRRSMSLRVLTVCIGSRVSCSVIKEM